MSLYCTNDDLYNRMTNATNYKKDYRQNYTKQLARKRAASSGGGVRLQQPLLAGDL